MSYLISSYFSVSDSDLFEGSFLNDSDSETDSEHSQLKECNQGMALYFMYQKIIKHLNQFLKKDANSKKH